MVNEVAIDGGVSALDGNRGNAKPVRIDVLRGFVSLSFSEKQDVRHNGSTFTLKGIRWETDSTYEIGLRGEVFPSGGILLIEGEVGSD